MSTTLAGLLPAFRVDRKVSRAGRFTVYRRARYAHGLVFHDHFVVQQQPHAAVTAFVGVEAACDHGVDGATLTMEVDDDWLARDAKKIVTQAERHFAAVTKAYLADAKKCARLPALYATWSRGSGRKTTAAFARYAREKRVTNPVCLENFLRAPRPPEEA